MMGSRFAIDFFFGFYDKLAKAPQVVKKEKVGKGEGAACFTLKGFVGCAFPFLFFFNSEIRYHLDQKQIDQRVASQS